MLVNKEVFVAREEKGGGWERESVREKEKRERKKRTDIERNTE